MKLYNLPGCPYCAMVREKLAELDLSYEQIDVPADRQQRTEVMRISGQPTVPVLVDGEKVFADENDIIAYLEEKYGSKARADRR